jgi:hypothetical protein
VLPSLPANADRDPHCGLIHLGTGFAHLPQHGNDRGRRGVIQIHEIQQEGRF